MILYWKKKLDWDRIENLKKISLRRTEWDKQLCNRLIALRHEIESLIVKQDELIKSCYIYFEESVEFRESPKIVAKIDLNCSFIPDELDKKISRLMEINYTKIV